MRKKSLSPHEALLAFIKANSEGHTTKDAFEFYKNPDAMTIGSFEFDGEMLIGISLAGLLEGKIVNSLIVVHKKYRNRGIGTKLLRETMEKVKSAGLTYEAFVAEDNLPSLRIFEKCKTEMIDQIPRVRKSGKFRALKFVK